MGFLQQIRKRYDVFCRLESFHIQGRLLFGAVLFRKNFSNEICQSCREISILALLIKGTYGESVIISQTVAERILKPIVAYTENRREYQYASGVKIREGLYCHSGSNRG